MWYSFACVAVAANHPDDALEYLREAIKHGYKDADGLTADDNLKSLRQSPQFQQLLAELKHPPAAAQTQWNKMLKSWFCASSSKFVGKPKRCGKTASVRG